MLLGRANFVSAYRLGNWVREHGSTLNADDKAILNELLDWFKDPACSGILADFIENCSDLPSAMRAEDICLTGSSEEESESEHYETNREQAANADIILTSHAMLISDSHCLCNFAAQTNRSSGQRCIVSVGHWQCHPVIKAKNRAGQKNMQYSMPQP